MKTKPVFRKDNKQTSALVKAAKTAAETANRASRALGLTVAFIKDGVIYEEQQGKVTVREHIKEEVDSTIKLKKGLILHAKH